MRVLLSSYACEPGTGSETGKGWNFATALARYGCDVVVLTCGSHHREKIEAYCKDHEIPPNLSFAWHDVPGWRGPGYASAKYIRQHYMAWQITARREAKRLHALHAFDVIHHLTWTVLRWPSFLGGIGPRFVFGPVGGGEVTPPLLRHSFPPQGRKRERFRDIVNFASRLDPMVLNCLRRADAILVTDKATEKHIPTRWQRKTFVLPDIFAPAISQAAPERAPSQNGPALLFAGRLEYWKGAQLALGSIALLKSRLPGASLTIAGSGPDEAFLRETALTLGTGDAARFIGMVPHDKMTALYAAHDLFLFPSFHDSGPHVIGEALANGLPVICLDLGGPGVAIDESCGAVIPTRRQSLSEVQAALAAAIEHIATDPARLRELRKGALARAEQFQYDKRVSDMVERFYAPGPH